MYLISITKFIRNVAVILMLHSKRSQIYRIPANSNSWQRKEVLNCGSMKFAHSLYNVYSIVYMQWKCKSKGILWFRVQNNWWICGVQLNSCTVAGSNATWLGNNNLKKFCFCGRVVNLPFIDRKCITLVDKFSPVCLWKHLCSQFRPERNETARTWERSTMHFCSH